MFVQVIEGRTTDPDGLRAQFDKWVAELQPGATGYVGTTAGVAADGRVVCLRPVRVGGRRRGPTASGPSRARGGPRPRSCSTGPSSSPSRATSRQFLAGGSDDAGFVQVMKVAGVDRAKVEAGDTQFETAGRHAAPRSDRRRARVDRARQHDRGQLLHERGRSPRGRESAAAREFAEGVRRLHGDDEQGRVRRLLEPVPALRLTRR